MSQCWPRRFLCFLADGSGFRGFRDGSWVKALAAKPKRPKFSPQDPQSGRRKQTFPGCLSSMWAVDALSHLSRLTGKKDLLQSLGPAGKTSSSGSVQGTPPGLPSLPRPEGQPCREPPAQLASEVTHSSSQLPLSGRVDCRMMAPDLPGVPWGGATLSHLPGWLLPCLRSAAAPFLHFSQVV